MLNVSDCIPTGRQEVITEHKALGPEVSLCVGPEVSLCVSSNPPATEAVPVVLGRPTLHF